MSGFFFWFKAAVLVVFLVNMWYLATAKHGTYREHKALIACALNAAIWALFDFISEYWA